MDDRIEERLMWIISSSSSSVLMFHSWNFGDPSPNYFFHQSPVCSAFHSKQSLFQGLVRDLLDLVYSSFLRTSSVMELFFRLVVHGILKVCVHPHILKILILRLLIIFRRLPIEFWKMGSESHPHSFRYPIVSLWRIWFDCFPKNFENPISQDRCVPYILDFILLITFS